MKQFFVRYIIELSGTADTNRNQESRLEQSVDEVIHTMLDAIDTMLPNKNEKLKVRVKKDLTK